MIVWFISLKTVFWSSTPKPMSGSMMWIFRIPQMLTGGIISIRTDIYTLIYSLGDKGEVIRFDPTDGTVHTVYSSLRYQIKNYKVYADDLLQFSGFDLQTGAKVIVQVKNGQEVILDKIDGREIIQMEQIN